MDVKSLVEILVAARSADPTERKAAEQSLDQIEHAPEHLVRVLQIVMDGKTDVMVRVMTGIYFKNFVKRNWAPRDRSGANPEISPSDKQVVRENILNFGIPVPPLLRVQLDEGLKTMIRADYPEQWPTLLHWVKHNLQNQRVYGPVNGALLVLRIIFKKYEVKLDEERMLVHQIVEETFPLLLNIFKQLVQNVKPSIKVADCVELICKIFWSSVYMEIPRQLFDPNTFNAWMLLFFDIMVSHVLLEGQPGDLEPKKLWGWWKVKKRIVQIFYRLDTRFGDVKCRNPDNKAFAKMFQTNYAGKILECHLTLLNAICVGGYLPDRIINLTLQYLGSSISKSIMYKQLQPRLDVLLFNIIFRLMCFNDNDQRLWDEDPHEYVRKGYDRVEDLYSPRTAAMGFMSELMRKHGKENLHKIILFIAGIFRRYGEAAPENKPHRQKDGALLAIGVLCDKLRQTEPYKYQLELTLVQHVFPEFSSPVGHLRAKAAWVAGKYACISFSDPDNFRRALRSVIAGTRDLELPVRVDSVCALRSFVEACKDLGEIRTILPHFLDDFFKLMNEVQNEDLVSTLETIVDKFGKEIAPYAIGLCQNLAAAFWKSANTAGTVEEGDANTLAAGGCLRAISTILKSVRSLPHFYVQIESTLLPILRRMLTTNAEVLEEVLEIISYLTFYSPTISLEMWSLWPLMMEILTVWAIEFFPNILVSLVNYISRSTSHFLMCKKPDYQQSLWNMISSVMKNENWDDSDIEPAPKLIQVVFQNCRGNLDHWVEPYLRISVERLFRTETSRLKCRLMEVVADSLYYNAPLALQILQKLNVATEVFNFWFEMLQQTKRSGVRTNFKREHEKKVCCLGLTSLLPLPADQLPGEALERIYKSALDLLVAYKDQIAEAAKEEEGNDDDDMSNFQTDDEGDDVDDTDKDMGVDAEDEDGNDAESLEHKKLASQDKAFRTTESDDENSDDDLSDLEEFQSPIDDIDPFVFFVDTIIVLQASDPLRLQNLTQTLDLQYQAISAGITQHAKDRRTEIEKAKLAKVTKSAD